MLRHPELSIGNMHVTAVRTLSTYENNRSNSVELIGEASDAIAAVNRAGSLWLDVVVRNEIPAAHSNDAVKGKFLPA